MAFNPKDYFSNYFKKKKPLGIFFDVVFVVIVILLLIPATRKETAAFFIRWTSFPASTLDNDEQYNVNKETLNWQLTTLDGERVSFEDLNEKPVFLNIWATWCPPCIAELPGIEELHEQYGDEVNFVLVSNEQPDVVASFAEKHDYASLPFYYSNFSPSDFSTQSIPATFILSRDGRVLLVKKGAARWNADKTKNLLEELVKR